MNKQRRINFLKIFFPKKVDFLKLKLDKASSYSMSGIDAVKMISKMISKTVPKTVHILDGTANVGSDSIGLALEFPTATIHSVELNKETYKYLENNVKDVYGKLINNIKIYNDSVINILEKNRIKYDIIYIDAPWGGKNYIKKEKMKLYLDKIEIKDVYIKYKDKGKHFIFKVPINYDFNYFIGKEDIRIVPYIRNDRVRFYLIIL